MKRATVVIGANFGDEGKGLLTDYHCNRLGPDTTVVRYSGGANAGHTVVTPDGRRHVFGHFGSGAFAGADTFLSRYFVVNPILWKQELDTFPDLKNHRVTVHPDAPLTTHYDMLINRAIEESRGENRHGSCGVGINETITRNNHFDYMTYAYDIENIDYLKNKLLMIRDLYVPQRLKELGVKPSEELMESLQSCEFTNKFIENCAEFCADVSFLVHWDGFKGFITNPALKNIVFEGSQGLLLDEDHRFFPYVSRCKPGLHNVAILAREVGIETLDVTYVTRAYMTRHGPGPFRTEQKHLGFPDPTNLYNPWQGSLRFGCLDVDLLAESISADLSEIDDLEINPSIAITCLDQVGERIQVAKGDNWYWLNQSDFTDLIAGETGFNNLLLSHGPTRETISSMSI